MPTPIAIPAAPFWQPKAGAPGETVQGMEELAQSLDTLFRTQAGSVPLMPRYGFDAASALGKPLQTAKRLLERLAVEAFYWEPRVECLSAKAEIVEDAAASAVLLCLVWRPVGASDAVAQVVVI
jgi:phage baseplate assembly protein W